MYISVLEMGQKETECAQVAVLLYIKYGAESACRLRARGKSLGT